jgi:hypothetical protein
MSTIEEELASDVKFLGELAVEADTEDVAAADQLRRIIDKLGMMSAAMFTPRIQLEKKAEKRAAEWLDTCLDTEFEQHEEIQLFLWLIQLRLKQAASSAMVGSVGVTLASILAGAGKGKAPLDPDDK